MNQPTEHSIDYYRERISQKIAWDDQLQSALEANVRARAIHQLPPVCPGVHLLSGQFMRCRNSHPASASVTTPMIAMGQYWLNSSP